MERECVGTVPSPFHVLLQIELEAVSKWLFFLSPHCFYVSTTSVPASTASHMLLLPAMERLSSWRRLRKHVKCLLKFRGFQTCICWALLACYAWTCRLHYIHCCSYITSRMETNQTYLATKRFAVSCTKQGFRTFGAFCSNSLCIHWNSI